MIRFLVDKALVVDDAYVASNGVVKYVLICWLMKLFVAVSV
jgi:hypothetical protein